MSITENISEEEENKPSRIRRTKVMIARENKQILDYIVKGAMHEQIMKRVCLSEKNYWKRIAAIRKRDMELTKTEQTPEAHAFLYKRTEEKLHNLEAMTLQIAESENEQARDRIEAMRFLRQLFVDQYSLFMYGPSQFLTRDISSGDGNMAGSVQRRQTMKKQRMIVLTQYSNLDFCLLIPTKILGYLISYNSISTHLSQCMHKSRLQSFLLKLRLWA
jgi:hypothetical protein